MQSPVKINLDTYAGRYVVIRVSQNLANYVVSVSQTDSGNRFKFDHDFTSYLGLDELVLVDKSKCLECVVEVRAAEEIDKTSGYSISVSEISANDGNLALIRSISNAARLKAKANGFPVNEGREKVFEEIIRELKGGLKFRQESTNPINIGHAQDLLGLIYGYLGSWNDAEKYFRAAVEEKGIENSLPKAMAFMELGPFESNAEAERQAYMTGGAMGRILGNRRVEAKAKNFEGIRLANEGNYVDGLKYINDAYDIYLSIGAQRDMLESVHNLSWINQRLDQYSNAISYAIEQKVRAEKYGSDKDVAKAFYNLGLAHFHAGDIYKSEKYFDEALNTLTLLPAEKRDLKGAILIEKVKIFLEIKDVELARKHVTEVQYFHQNKDWTRETVKGKFWMAELLSEEGKAIEAEQTLIEAQSISEKKGYLRLTARILMSLAKIHLSENRLVEAHKYIQRAILILNRLDDPGTLIESVIQSIEILIESNAPKHALEIASELKAIVNESGSPGSKAKYYYLRAKAFKNIGDTDEALKSVSVAKAVFDERLPKIFRDDLKQAYVALNKAVFELNIELLIGLGDSGVVDALWLADSYKARTLSAKVVSRSSLGTASKGGEEERERILEDLVSLAAHTLGSSESNQRAALDRALELRSRLDKIEAKAKEGLDANAVYQVVNRSKQALSLKHDEVIVSYFLGEDAGWMWVSSHGGTKVYRIPNKAKLEELASVVLDLISTHPLSRKGSGYWDQIQAINNLSNAVLKPLGSAFDITNFSTITFIPDGVLHQIPFSMLVVPGEQKKIIERVAVVYLPSIRNRGVDLNFSYSGDDDSGLKALAVTDPEFKGAMATNFPQLSASRYEGQTIRKHLESGVKHLTGHESSKANVLKEIAQGYPLLHFATHGVLNDQEPLLSGLVFSSSDLKEGMWLAPEISSLNIQSDLVVLSACETAIGKSREGEGLLSLSRAFLEAGANKVVGAYWRVQDDSTSELFGEFYNNLLQKKLPVSKALQYAKLAVYNNTQRDWEDPYYWAGFRLQVMGE